MTQEKEEEIKERQQQKKKIQNCGTCIAHFRPVSIRRKWLKIVPPPIVRITYLELDNIMNLHNCISPAKVKVAKIVTDL